MQRGEGGRAIALQKENVRDAPIETDLIAGSAQLWMLLHFQLVTGQVEPALASLERLTEQIAPGAIPFAGFFVLQHWPEYVGIRADPRFARRLVRIRPEYAADWPGMTEDGQ